MALFCIFCLTAFAVSFLGTGARAIPVSFNFDWTGDGGYSMTGMFTGEDLNADEVIRDTEVTSLMFEGFLNAASIGSTSGAQALTGGVGGAFNFNFDLATQTFLDGGVINGDGQNWNSGGPGLGFADGSGVAVLVQNMSPVVGSITHDPQAYSASPKAVPEPATILLVSAGLLGLWGRGSAVYGSANRKRHLMRSASHQNSDTAIVVRPTIPR